MWWTRTPAKILEQPKARLAINELIERIKSDRSFEQLSRAEQILVLTVRLRDEVLNGTIWQYLSNSSGDMFEDAVRALDEIGACECSGALRDVANWFPDGLPDADRATRNEQMNRIDVAGPEREARIREVTDRLCSAFPTMLNHLITYLRAHVSELK